MKTAMQQLLEHFQYVRELDPYVQTILLEQRCKELIEVEKEQMQVTSDSIVENVVVQFRERSQTGIKKYGTTLDRNDLTTKQWLHHLQEELMDAVNYIEKLKQIL